MDSTWYKNVLFGSISSVNLNINETNIIDFKAGDQFVKTCSSNQSFILVNPRVGNFRLILTGGSLSSTLFKSSNKSISVLTGNDTLSLYNNAEINIIDLTIIDVRDNSVILSIKLKPESVEADLDYEARERLLNLENHETIYQLFEYVGKSTSGTVTIPQEATIYDIYQDGVIDAIVVEASPYQTPIEKSSLNGAGEIVHVFSLATNGAYQLATAPVENSCILYFVKIKDYYKENIPLTKIVGVPLSGHDGVNGIDGLDINWRGTYNPLTLYAINDAVAYNGTSYIWINITPGSGQTPADNIYWDILALKGADGDDGSNGLNGNTPYIFNDNWWIDAVDTGIKAEGQDGYTPIKGIDYNDGIDGEDGDSAYQIAVRNGFIGTEEEWLASIEGEQVLLQNNGTHIQWKYTNDLIWNNLVALIDLKGDQGIQGETGLQGVKGDSGNSIELQTSLTHIQWRVVGDVNWINLIPLSELKGERGIQGIQGEKGDKGDSGVVDYNLVMAYSIALG